MTALEPDPDCVFCGQNPNEIWRNENFAVCLDPAPLAPGHLLLYPLDHFPSAADLSVSLAAEVDVMQREMSGRLCAIKGQLILFEHGRTGHCIRSRSGERMCHHMHIHLIPAALDVTALVPFGQSIEVRSWKEIVALGEETDGYAVISRPSGDLTFYPIGHDLPPHYLRTLIAEGLGDPSLADWETIVQSPRCEDLAVASRAVIESVVGITPAIAR